MESGSLSGEQKLEEVNEEYKGEYKGEEKNNKEKETKEKVQEIIQAFGNNAPKIMLETISAKTATVITFSLSSSFLSSFKSF